MNLRAMPKILPFGPEYVLPPNQSTRLRWGIKNLLSMELLFGGEFHANRSSGRWRWVFRNIWKPEVVEISEVHFRYQAWRMLLRYGCFSDPSDIRDVIDATKFLAMHLEYRPGESGRLYPYVWGGKFIPPYAGPHEILLQPRQEVIRMSISPGRITDVDTDPASRGNVPHLAETSHANHESENRNDPTPTSAPRPAQPTGNGSRIFSPARSYDFPN